MKSNVPTSFDKNTSFVQPINSTPTSKNKRSRYVFTTTGAREANFEPHKDFEYNPNSRNQAARSSKKIVSYDPNAIDST